MRKKALVLDDVKLNQLTISSFLQLSGFDVDIEVDGLKGLKIISENKYDLIFSDIEMPNMNGLEFLKRVKSMDSHKNIPIVILSSVNKQDIIDKALHLGAVSYINKPYNREKMISALGKAGFVI
ncbi:MAG: response regulator, partial [Candidatus Sericytochromatia bacterium]